DVPSWRTWLRAMWADRQQVRELYDVRHWSERTVIALVMQSRDNSITTYLKKNRLGRLVLTSKQGHGEPNPTWIPAGNEAARRMADVMGGTAGGTIGEPFNRPLTAHFIGGCTIGDSAESGGTPAADRPRHLIFTGLSRNPLYLGSLDGWVHLLCSLTEWTRTPGRVTLSAKQGPATLPPRPGPVYFPASTALRPVSAAA